MIMLVQILYILYLQSDSITQLLTFYDWLGVPIIIGAIAAMVSELSRALMQRRSQSG